MNNQNEATFDMLEISPKGYEEISLVDGTRLTDIFPDGMIAIFNQEGRAIAIESATEAKRDVIFGKGVEECVKAQRAINLLLEHQRSR
jgi:hypothetical protein